ATKKLYELGAKSVECACVHAVLADFAAVKLFSSGVREIVATDTVERIYSKISVSKILAEKII
ncbi:MAG: ribose-phosphate pyrophosphokinase, partial [Archaeoglobaceae archaeon]